MRPSELQQKTMEFLQDLFAPDPVPIFTDRSTGQSVVDVRQVCEKLGMDPDKEISKLMTDAVLSRGIVVIDK